MSSAPCKLIIVGTPLNDEEPLTAAALDALRTARVAIGESRRRALPLLKRAGNPDAKVHLLDNIKAESWRELVSDLTALSDEGGVAVLFSDSGLPILFDPGAEVLATCRKLGFEIHVVPAATSWGTAAAVSGFEPPFLIVGFPPQKSEERARFLGKLAMEPHTIVLMDAPYRFRLLLGESIRAFGKDRQAFLGWELSNPVEKCLWGSLKKILEASEQADLQKGEFILVIEGK